MIQQILIEAEPHGDEKSAFRLSIDAVLVAKGVTVGQACYVVGEILQRIGVASDADTTTFNPFGDVEGSCETEGDRGDLEAQIEAAAG
jgi:hypothetical protein